MGKLPGSEGQGHWGTQLLEGSVGFFFSQNWRGGDFVKEERWVTAKQLAPPGCGADFPLEKSSHCL